MSRLKYIFAILLVALCPVLAMANHGALRVDPFNTLPDSNTRTFRTDSRTHWEHEASQWSGRINAPFVYSGGLHGISTTLTSTAFATEAFVPERVNQAAVAITYVAIAADVCWTIISSDNDGITGWTRVTTGTPAVNTSYYYQCEGDSTPNQPTLPANSVWLMGPVTITASAIAVVTDKRSLGSSLVVPIERYASIVAALDDVKSVGAPTVHLLVRSTIDITSSITIPSNVTTLFVGTGRFTIDTGVTVTHNGFFDAPCESGKGYISLTGTGILLLNQQSQVCPEWWGAYSDNTNAATTVAAINNAINSVQTNGGIVRFGTGTYRVQGGAGGFDTAIWIRRSNVGLRCAGYGSVIQANGNNDVGILISSSQSTTDVSPTADITGVSISDCRIVGTGVHVYSALQSSRGIIAIRTRDLAIHHNWINSWGMIGIEIRQGNTGETAFTSISDNHCGNNLFTGINFNGSGRLSFISNNIVYGTTASINSSGLQVAGSGTINGNQVYNSAGYGILIGESDAFYPIIVTGNFVKTTAGPGILSNYHGPAVITNNTVINAQGTGGIVTSGNTLPGLTVPGQSNIIGNNLVINSYTYGIHVSANNTIVIGNNIRYINPLLGNNSGIDQIAVLTRYEAGIFLAAHGAQVTGNTIDGALGGIHVYLSLDRSIVHIHGNAFVNLTGQEFSWVNTAGAVQYNLLMPDSTSGGRIWVIPNSSGVIPGAGHFLRGDISRRTEPAAGAVPGWVNVFHLATTVATTFGSSNTFDVVSAVGVAVGDNISIVQLSGSTLTVLASSTVTVVAGNTISIGVVTSGTLGDVVRFDRWRAQAALAP